MRDTPDRIEAVVKAARAYDKALGRRNPDGSANNATWNAIERKENSMLRAVERLAGLKRRSLGVRDSE